MPDLSARHFLLAEKLSDFQSGTVSEKQLSAFKNLITKNIKYGFKH